MDFKVERRRVAQNSPSYPQGTHVEDAGGAYVTGWVRRAESASSTTEVSGWGGNLAVQKLA